jgi:LmbE family N-acetylglucosaminyl deacetylase
MQWVYLSPHLDDVALSCGGLLWEQAHSGIIPSVWTICAGDPPAGPFSAFAEELHRRWGKGREAIEARLREDIFSCERLGADFQHLPVPDCIYRRSPSTGEALYASEEAIFSSLQPEEIDLLDGLAGMLAQKLHNLGAQAQLICPLGLGGHVDHRLTRAAAERLGHSLWYYPDYPYVLDHSSSFAAYLPTGWEPILYPLSAAGLQAWVEAVAAHRSQISTFWPDVQAMQQAIREYAGQHGGVRLWRPARQDR